MLFDAEGFVRPNSASSILISLLERSKLKLLLQLNKLHTQVNTHGRINPRDKIQELVTN